MEDNTTPKVKLGVIPRDSRFKVPKEASPGPGNYNTHLFKSLSKGEFSILNTITEDSPTQIKSLAPFCQSSNTLNHTSRRQ